MKRQFATLFILLGLLISNTGCGVYYWVALVAALGKKSENKTDTWEIKPNFPKPSGPEGYTPTRVVETKEIWQQAKRFGCEGEFLDQVPVRIQTSREQVKVNPHNNIPIEKARFYVERTDSKCRAIPWSSELKYLYVTVGATDSVWGDVCRVEGGENILKYTYETCQHTPEAGKSCEQWHLEEEGTITLIVNVTKEWRQGICELRPKRCRWGKVIEWRDCAEPSPRS